MAKAKKKKSRGKSYKTAAPAPAARRPLPLRATRAKVSQRVRRLRVPVEQLTWSCDPQLFDFRNTKEVRPLRGMLGQRQALKTLSLGLAMHGHGYNLFICGLSSTESIAELVDHIARERLEWERPPDRCYVHNFADPLRPKLLELPAGRGAALADGVHALLVRLHRALDKVPEQNRKNVAAKVLREGVAGLDAEFPLKSIRSFLRGWRRHLIDHIFDAYIEDFEINLLTQPARKKAPVIFEQNPSASNLFGWVGRRSMGEAGQVPHFSEIHAGSLLSADGGVLVLNAADFQGHLNVWNGLKTCLKYGRLCIDDSDGAGPRSGMRPEPIPIRTKVILVGDFGLYDHLFEVEPDFPDVFKIRVDFDSEVPLTSKIIRKDYPALVSRSCERRGLRPVSASGVARVLEFAVRKAGRKRKVIAETAVVEDLLREADYWCRVENRRVITGADVQRAVSEAVLRLNLVETKISEMISEGTILITTSGERIGQVNGLAIYDMGDYLFAKPSRITAETSVGQSGIINIEREVGFSGRSHDKGVHILVAYLRSLFAQTRPLSLTASVCFEQSYSGIDGDSASASEIYAILSSLSGLPVRQDIAVTGSLNQKGDMQPIGGANEKIEGFFDCVRASRPSGREGVIIPSKNLRELVLRQDVVKAIARRKFHVFAIDTIDQGIEILTGVPAGRRLKSGRYTPGSVFDLVDRRLEEIAHGLRRYQDHEEE